MARIKFCISNDRTGNRLTRSGGRVVVSVDEDWPPYDLDDPTIWVDGAEFKFTARDKESTWSDDFLTVEFDAIRPGSPRTTSFIASSNFMDAPSTLVIDMSIDVRQAGTRKRIRGTFVEVGESGSPEFEWPGGQNSFDMTVRREVCRELRFVGELQDFGFEDVNKKPDSPDPDEGDPDKDMLPGSDVSVSDEVGGARRLRTRAGGNVMRYLGVSDRDLRWINPYETQLFSDEHDRGDYKPRTDGLVHDPVGECAWSSR